MSLPEGSGLGTILLYREHGQEFIIKTAMGRGPLLWLRRKTLRREYRACRQLEGVAGIPACHGFIEGRYLIVQHVQGQPYRGAESADREAFFRQLLEILQAVHARGVAHGDLKSKRYLLVTESQQPCVIDFGTAFRQKSRWHFINNWFYRTAKRLDLNACVMHKYRGHYSEASAENAKLLDYGWLEKLVRRVSGRPMSQVYRNVEGSG